MSNPLAVFRTCASREIGGGHVTRCISLAHHFSELGWDCIFACEPETETIIPTINQFEIFKIKHTTPKEEANFIRNNLNRNPNILILDHYNRDRTFEQCCRSWANKILVIDDLANRPHDTDLLLDQSGGRLPAHYVHLVPDTCQLMLGPKYSLLRHFFNSTQAGHLSRAMSTPPRIFVSMGATDFLNLTEQVLNVISNTSSEVKVDILLSEKAPHLLNLQNFCSQNPRFSLHTGLTNPAKIMREATFSVGTAGINLWERCALGIPSIIIIGAENQRLNAEHVIKFGGGVFGGTGPSIDQKYLASATLTLINNQKILKKMAISAKNICDGKGVKRVAKKIISVLN